MKQSVTVLEQSLYWAVRHVGQHWVAWAVLFSGLVMTAIYSGFSKSDAESRAHVRFTFECTDIVTRVMARLDTHRQILLGGVALFDASDSVSRDEWHRYANRMAINENLNGIQGLGYAVRLDPTDLPDHIRRVRRDGYPEYTVWPAGDRGLYSAIQYLEPFDVRNQRAFGFDMYSEPTRREAMSRARDGQQAALSGKVTLVQEGRTDVQAGTLMYLPVYRKGSALNTVAQRRDALVGWVYSPFRMANLMRGIIPEGAQSQVHLRVFDGTERLPSRLLYDSDPQEADPDHIRHGLFHFVQQMDFNGRIWSMDFTFDPEPGRGVDYSEYRLALMAGIFSSILAFLLILALSNTRRRAQRLADEATAELRESETKLRTLYNAITDAVLLLDGGRIVDCNRAATILFGCADKAQLCASELADFFPERQPDGHLSETEMGYRTARALEKGSDSFEW